MDPVRAKRPFWTYLILTVGLVLVLNALLGSASSPVPRLLHISHVPTWWPLVLALVAGVVLGGLVNRDRTPNPSTRGKPAPPATSGRYAVPRHIRRERERLERRNERLQKAAETAAAAAAVSAPAAPPPPKGLGRVWAALRRGGSR